MRHPDPLCPVPLHELDYCDVWMRDYDLAQAIPPAYTEHIGRILLDHLAGVPA